MKFCPVCKTSYDEDILLFCTKDGTPLVEEGEPNFSALPSEDDLDEETVIRRKTPPTAPIDAQPVPDFDEPERTSSPRIVIPMSGEDELPEPPKREAVRAMTTESIRRQPPPQKSNTAMVVFLTVLGTVVVLVGAVGVFWFLSNKNSANTNQANYNANFNSIDINLNANSSVSNSLADFNYNINSDSNENTNLKTPTPTPTRTPTPTPTPVTDTNSNSAINMDMNALPPTNVRPTIRPTPSATPRFAPSPTPRTSPGDTPLGHPVSTPEL